MTAVYLIQHHGKFQKWMPPIKVTITLFNLILKFKHFRMTKLRHSQGPGKIARGRENGRRQVKENKERRGQGRWGQLQRDPGMNMSGCQGDRKSASDAVKSPFAQFNSCFLQTLTSNFPKGSPRPKSRGPVVCTSLLPMKTQNKTATSFFS